jgi:hypothetical protein
MNKEEMKTAGHVLARSNFLAPFSMTRALDIPTPRSPRPSFQASINFVPIEVSDWLLACLLTMPSSVSSNLTSSSFVNTPNSSPPPADIQTMKEHGISEAMRLEEEQMEQKRQKEQAKRDEEMAQERQKDVAGGEQVVDKKFKALEFLLNQSKVRTHTTCFLSVD